MSLVQKSAEVAVYFADRVIEAYSFRLDTLEQTNRIRISNNRLEGDPLVIWLDPPVDPGLFIRAVFAGVQPFRLMGIPRQIDPDYWVIPAVDLHGGHRLDFEVAPEFVRIYLRGEACANSALRFEANLQHHLSGDSRLIAKSPTTAPDASS